MTWDVAQHNGSWFLFIYRDYAPAQEYEIGSANMAWELAVDAACEFMDRMDRTRLTLEGLMATCVAAARRQR